MFQNIFQTYTLQSATIEILSMLLVMFLLGMAFGWLVKPRRWESQTEKGVKVAAAKKALILEEKEDDLKLIEWIGSAIEKVLFKYWVRTYSDVVSEDVVGLEEILKQAGSKYAMHNPATWPDQARLAMQKKWSELEEYQEILTQGRKK